MAIKRVSRKASWRQSAYEASPAFREALAVAQHDLRHAASQDRAEVEAFLSWLRDGGLETNRRQILKKTEKFDHRAAAALLLYVGFVLRFRVQLKLVERVGGIDFVPIYKGPAHRQLSVDLSGGKLISPPADPDDDVRDRFASIGGLPAEIRNRIKKKRARILMSEQADAADAQLRGRGMSEEDVSALRAVLRRRGRNPEDERICTIEVTSRSTSSLTRLLDIAYDPVSITFLFVSARGQTRMMCLVGELVSEDDWNRAGAVRTTAQSVISKKAAAGAPFDAEQFADDISKISQDGSIPKAAVIDVGGADPKNMKNTQKRLQRARSRLERIRKEITF